MAPGAPSAPATSGAVSAIRAPSSVPEAIESVVTTGASLSTSDRSVARTSARLTPSSLTLWTTVMTTSAAA